MKQPTKFQRWFLGLFGGVPKSDYKALEIGIELKEKLVELTEKQARMACAKNDELLKENELLKKQVAHDPMTPVAITRRERNIKLKAIKKSARIDLLPMEQVQFRLSTMILSEVTPFIKIEYETERSIITATLLVAEVEECG